MYEDIFNFFDGSWCPLFGALPDMNLPIYDPVKQTCGIIRKARGLWEINSDEFRKFASNYPDKDEVTSCVTFAFEEIPYPAFLIIEARKIFRNAPSIKQYAACTDKGTAFPHREINTVPEKAVSFSRLLPRARIDKKISDFRVLAILAIFEARGALIDRIKYDDQAGALQREQIAIDLLRRAEKLESAADVASLQDEVALERELANKERRNQSFRRQGGQEKANRHKPLHEEWQKKAKEIRKRNPDLSKRKIAKLISRKTGCPEETIRKNI